MQLALLSFGIVIVATLLFTDILPPLQPKTVPSPATLSQNVVVITRTETAPRTPTAQAAVVTDLVEKVTAPEEPLGATIPVPQPQIGNYIKVVDGCGAYFTGECVNVRAQLGTSSPIVGQLRNGMVLKTSGSTEHEGRTWYKVVFDEWVRYPERVKSSWFVAADYVQAFTHEGAQDLGTSTTASTTKRIVVDRGDQTLFAYDGDALFMEEKISTGTTLNPTPRGTFAIYRKTPSRYMQGPLPGISDQTFDLPGVPWVLYFTQEGGAIHGAYWHEKFGQEWSRGCVNLPPLKAERLYEWADLGTPVLVRD